MSAIGLLGAALDEVRAYRLRAFLATLSILVGVATLTLIVGLGDIAQATARAVVEREVGRPATLRVSSEGSAGQFAGGALPRLETRLDRYRVDLRSRELTWASRVTAAGVTRPGTVFGVDPALSGIRRFRLAAGRWLIPEDDRLLAPVVVVNVTWLDELPLDKPVGSVLRLSYGTTETAARVVGVVDDGQRESRLYAPAEVLVAQTALARLAGATLFVRTDPSSARTLVQRLTADLRSAGYDRIQILRVDAGNDFASLFAILQLALASIAAISLITGALGILNLGIMTTHQRAREFAIRRSFGATTRDVFVIVMAETVATTSLGGLFGVVAAGALFSGIAYVIGVRLNSADVPPFPGEAAALGLVVSIAIGVLAGLLPARLATRVSIIDTIRA